jgi:ABC-type transport system involved in Fe-S cluster assembly fused permease/ATPase subunit
MVLLKRILFKAVFPPVVGFTILMGIIWLFPNISYKLFMFLMIVVYTLAQTFLVRD